MPKRAKFKLSNVNIQEISVTKSPAVNEANVIIRKSENSNNITVNPTIIHKNDKGQIFQYALVPNRVDKQGDIIEPIEIEKATEKLKKTIFDGNLKIGKEHSDFNNDVVDYAWTEYDVNGEISKAYGFPEDKIVKGSMIVAMQLTDLGKEKFDNGDFKGISIGGFTEKSEIEKSDNFDKIEKSKFLSFISKLFGLEDESEKINKDNFKSVIKSVVREELTEIMADKTVNYNGEKEKTEVKKSMQTLKNKDNTLTEKEIEQTDIEKTEKEIEQTDIENKSLDSLTKKISELEKKYTEQREDNKTLTESISQLTFIVKNLSEKLDSNTELTEKVAKAKGITKTADPKPIEKLFHDGLFGDDAE